MSVPWDLGQNRDKNIRKMSDNLGQSIVDKSEKLNRISFLMEYFSYAISDIFVAQLSKFHFFSGQLSTFNFLTS